MKFNNETWETLVESVSGTFRFTEIEVETLKGNNIAKLIAAVPYIAGCSNPARLSLSHLSTYLIACDSGCREVFAHGENDDVSLLKRLETIISFPDGSADILKRAAALLSLVSLNDHYADREADLKAGKYNPLNSGAWDYQEKRKALLAEIDETPSPEMDEIVPPLSPMGFWNVRPDGRFSKASAVKN